MTKPETGNEETGPVRVHVSQILCVVWIAAAIAWIIFCDWSVDWILLLGPSMIACIWPIARQRSLTAWTERVEGKLRAGLGRAEASGGKIATYFFVPFYRGSLWMWAKTRRVSDGHIRAGLRTGAALYFGVLMCALGLLAAYIFVLAILMILALIFVILALIVTLHLLLNEEGGNTSRGSFWHGTAKSPDAESAFGEPEIESARSNKSSRGKEYAHSKGQQDYSRSGGQVNSNPMTEFVHPTYDPPSGYEKEYAEGWNNAEKQDK